MSDFVNANVRRTKFLLIYARLVHTGIIRVATGLDFATRPDPRVQDLDRTRPASSKFQTRPDPRVWVFRPDPTRRAGDPRVGLNNMRENVYHALNLKVLPVVLTA